MTGSAVRDRIFGAVILALGGAVGGDIAGADHLVKRLDTGGSGWLETRMRGEGAAVTRRRGRHRLRYPPGIRSAQQVLDSRVGVKVDWGAGLLPRPFPGPAAFPLAGSLLAWQVIG